MHQRLRSKKKKLASNQQEKKREIVIFIKIKKFFIIFTHHHHHWLETEFWLVGWLISNQTTKIWLLFSWSPEEEEKKITQNQENLKKERNKFCIVIFFILFCFSSFPNLMFTTHTHHHTFLMYFLILFC